MRKHKTIIIFTIILVIGLGIFLKGQGVIGLGEKSIENDARVSQKIDETWISASETNDEMSALLFYDEALKAHTFSIYLNRPGFSYGYTFRHGGSSSTIDSGIIGYSYGAYGMVLMSMNTKEVSQIKLENQKSIEIIKIDDSQPFVLLVPEAIEKVSLFDIKGNDVPIDTIELY